MVYVHLATGFEEIEALTVVDVLRRAGIAVQTVYVPTPGDHYCCDGGLPVEGTHGITVKADLGFEEANYEDCEMLVLPGGMPGTKNLQTNEALAAKILDFAAKDKWLAAICAAPMVFAHLGLLDGKSAVIFPGMEYFLRKANVKKDKVVVDDRFITSRGPGTAFDFALKLVAVLKSKEEADELADAMVVG